MDDIERHRIATTTAHLVERGLDISEPTKLTVCPCCEQEKPDIRKRRKNTAYVNEESNWLVSCDECFQDTVAYYAELWADYYADCM